MYRTSHVLTTCSVQYNTQRAPPKSATINEKNVLVQWILQQSIPNFFLVMIDNYVSYYKRCFFFFFFGSEIRIRNLYLFQKKFASYM